jgi:hypothetical protein
MHWNARIQRYAVPFAITQRSNGDLSSAFSRVVKISHTYRLTSHCPTKWSAVLNHFWSLALWPVANVAVMW